MKFDQLLEIVGDEPLFETGLLLAGAVDPADVRRQLARWTRTGRLHRLRRGLYALAPPYRRRAPHPFLVANRLVPGSYVSGLSALAHAQRIPEYVPEVTSVAAARPELRSTALGRFSFRHLKGDLLFGYRCVEVGRHQQAFVARPEKALLDLVHLCPGGDESPHLAGLRLDLDALDLDLMERLAATAARPKLRRAARRVRAMAGDQADGFEVL